MVNETVIELDGVSALAAPSPSTDEFPLWSSKVRGPCEFIATRRITSGTVSPTRTAGAAGPNDSVASATVTLHVRLPRIPPPMVNVRSIGTGVTSPSSRLIARAEKKTNDS